MKEGGHMERKLRGIAGFFILVSVFLAYKVDPRWLYFTGFVGLNLFQSAFTNWCPMMWILKKLTEGGGCCTGSDTGAGKGKGGCCCGD